MGMITGIELTKSRAAVYVDGTLFLRMKRSFFDELPLEEGEDLDEEDYLNRLSARQSKPAYEAALDMLSDRDMTCDALKKALMRRGFLEPVADAVRDRLIENRLLDDQRFAQRYVELRKDSAVGRYALKRKLRAKGIEEETASDALEQLDDESQLAAAAELAKKLSKRYAVLPGYEARAKLSQALARRGFSWDVVREAIEQARPDGDEFDDI